MKFLICNIMFVFKSTNHKFIDYTCELLRYNKVMENGEIYKAINIQFLDNTLFNRNEVANCIDKYTKKKCTIFVFEEVVKCYIDTPRIKGVESFYYHILQPIIQIMLSKNKLLYLHSAAFMCNKGILLIGQRNSGKTTSSLSALLTGKKFLSDDCVFLDESLKAMTNYRPLHVNPSIGDSFNIDYRLAKSSKYLETEEEINYNPFEYHEQQMLKELLIEAIVLPHVFAGNGSYLKKIEDDLYIKSVLIDNFIKDIEKSSIYTKLLCLPFYEMQIGQECFYNYELISNFLEEI